jgi:hypothetical protein
MVADEVFAVVLPTLLVAMVVVVPAEVPPTVAFVVVAVVLLAVGLPDVLFAESSDPEQAAGSAKVASTSSFTAAWERRMA